MTGPEKLFAIILSILLRLPLAVYTGELFKLVSLEYKLLLSTLGREPSYVFPVIWIKEVFLVYLPKLFLNSVESTVPYFIF